MGSVSDSVMRISSPIKLTCFDSMHTCKRTYMYLYVGVTGLVLTGDFVQCRCSGPRTLSNSSRNSVLNFAKQDIAKFSWQCNAHFSPVRCT